MEPVVVREESFHTCFKEILELAKEHYEEIAWRKDVIPLNPDLERYAQLADKGFLKCFVIRNTEEKIIGYATYVISYHLHYRDILVATNDLVYVEKTKRGAMLGAKLLTFSEQCLKDMGAKMATLHIKTSLDWSVLALRLKYEHTEHNFFKWIGA